MTRLRTPFLALALSIMLAAGFTAPTFADDKDDIKRQQQENAEKLKDAQDNVQESTVAAKKAKAALDLASSRLVAAQNKLGQIRGRLAVAQVEDARLRAALAKAQADLASAQQRLVKAEKQHGTSERTVASFAVDSVMSGDAGLKAFGDLLRGADPAEFSEQMSMGTSVSDAQVAIMQELAASEVMLGVERDKVQALRDQVATQQEQAEAVVVQMQSLTAQAQTQAASVAQLVGVRKKVKAGADAALAADQELQAELEADRTRLANRLAAVVAKELAAARRAEERKKGKDSNDSSDSGGGGGTTGDSGGTLSYPVNGPITSPYGMRVHPITGVYKLHDGTDFGVGCGTPVKAAAGGTIIEQYYNSAYGNRVILNNGIKRGVSVITTYNHLSSFKYGTGTKVSRGQVIAYSGSTGYSTGCHLHFMVLVNGVTTNPMGWL